MLLVLGLQPQLRTRELSAVSSAWRGFVAQGWTERSVSAQSVAEERHYAHLNERRS